MRIKKYQVTGLAGGAIASALGTGKAIAHANHGETQPAATHPAESAEARALPETAPNHYDASTLASENSQGARGSSSEAIAVKPVSQQANVVSGVSLGVGEALLGAILAGPILLIALKRRLQA